MPNNNVKNQVAYVRAALGYDPMEIIGATNPMPTKGNPNGFGAFRSNPDDNPVMSPPAFDTGAPSHKARKGSTDPFRGKGI